jgi:hypothetical protein
MRLHFSWSYQLQGPAALWVASSVFVVVGGLIAFFLPAVLPRPPDPQAAPERAILLVRLLGGVFLLLGGLPLALLFGGLVVQRRSPQNLHVWYWWINFLGGLLGACAFAVPASLLFPIFGVLYLCRPNALFADESVASKNLMVGLVFSAIGGVVLVGIYFIGRSMYRERPRWQAGDDCREVSDPARPDGP